MDVKGRPKGSFGWLRWLELMFILYHFPVILPATAIRKDQACPGWMTHLCTLLIYSALLYAGVQLLTLPDGVGP
jgi:hypothetical protein